MSYAHLSITERSQLALLHRLGWSTREIAKVRILPRFLRKNLRKHYISLTIGQENVWAERRPTNHSWELCRTWLDNSSYKIKTAITVDTLRELFATFNAYEFLVKYC